MQGFLGVLQALRSVKRQHRFTEQYELVQGAHLGYMDREDAVAVNRRIIHIKPDIYIVADEAVHGGKPRIQAVLAFQ